MRMQRRQFRIGELAKHLGVERFVVRFWEQEFGLRTTRSQGGQRFYEEQDLERLQQIKHLLYDQGFTIAGAKKMLKDNAVDTPIIASHKTTIDDQPASSIQPVKEQLIELRSQLIKLQELL